MCQKTPDTYIFLGVQCICITQSTHMHGCMYVCIQVEGGLKENLCVHKPCSTGQ